MLSKFTTDNRDMQKVRRNYQQGKVAEALVLIKLKRVFGEENVRELNKWDKFGETRIYSPDCEVRKPGTDWWQPLEIKWTKSDLTFVGWKMNQFEAARAARPQIYLLQVSGKKLALIKPTDQCKNKSLGYCSKSVMSFKPTWYDSFDCLTTLL